MKSSPDFPPLSTVRDSFPSHGAPSMFTYLQFYSCQPIPLVCSVGPYSACRISACSDTSVEFLLLWHELTDVVVQTQYDGIKLHNIGRAWISAYLSDCRSDSILALEERLFCHSRLDHPFPALGS